MTFDQARRVADAVLTEGSSLHPYCTPATRNHVRWQFGVLAPPNAGTEHISKARTECLLLGNHGTPLDIRLRLLRLRTTNDQHEPGPPEEIDVPATLGHPCETAFELPTTHHEHGHQQAQSGLIRISAQPLDQQLWRLRIDIENRTHWGRTTRTTPDAALTRSMISTHTLLAARDATFLSLLDPPHWARPAAENCHNQHTWPVLVGQHKQVMLSSPVILYDNPEQELLETRA